MNKSFSYFIAVVLCLLQSNVSLGQQGQPVAVSPEAAALSKQINYPVNLNTGVPDISVPLYEIKTKTMALPVVLSYHAGGFRINEQSTRTGLGWTLSTDLQITRQINGLDDFKATFGYIANTKMKGKDTLYYADNYSYPLQALSPFPYRNSYDIAFSNIDGMPDQFNYKLLNKSGSFYFQKNYAGTGYSIVSVPYDDIQISYNQGQFKIVDTDGTVYYFGSIIIPPNDSDDGAEKGFEYSGAIGIGTCLDCVISTWKCKKIEDASKTDSITFKYEDRLVTKYRTYNDRVEFYENEQGPCGMDYYFKSDLPPMNTPNTYESLLGVVDFWSISSPKYMQYTNNGTKFHVPYVNSTTGVVGDKTYDKTSGSNYTSSDVKGISLEEINFSGGSVVFTGADELEKITIFDDQQNPIRMFTFLQSYTPPAYITEAKLMNGPDYQGTLYLDGIEMSSGTGEVVENYSFMYTNKECFGNHLKGHDAWGYRNLSTVETGSPYAGFSAVPQHSWSGRYYFMCNSFQNINIQFGGNSNLEVPDENSIKKGILKRIVYPTGGYTEFTFESNRYKTSGAPSQNYIGGGLRIKDIVHYTATGNAAAHEYFKYGEDEDGAGILLAPPALELDVNGQMLYKGYSYEQLCAYLTGPNDVPGNGTPPFYPIHIDCQNRGCLSVRAKEKKTTYLPSSSLDYTYPDGSPIYYTQVTTYRESGGNNTGKTEQFYYSPTKFFSASTPFYEESVVSGTPIRRIQAQGFMGEKKAEIQYKKEGSTFLPVKKVEFFYKKYLRPTQVRVVYAFPRVLFEVVGGNFSSFHPDLYNQAIGFGSGADPGDYYVSGQYGIPVGRLLLATRIDTDYSDGVGVTNRMDYYYDNSNYIQPSRIRTKRSDGKEVETVLKYCYDFSTTDYIAMKNQNILAPVIEERMQLVNPVKELSLIKREWGQISVINNFLAPLWEDRSYNGGTPEREVSFDQYGTNARLHTITIKNIPYSYIWGYNGQYPIAEVKNARQKDAVYGPVPDGGYLNFPTTNGATSQVTFTTYGTGTVTVELGPGSFLDVGTTLYVNYYLSGNGLTRYGTFCMNNTSTSSCYYATPSSHNTVDLTGIPEGTYTLEVTCTTNIPGRGATVLYSYTKAGEVEPSGTEFFYEGFEEYTGASTSTPYAGRRYKTGNFTVPFVRPNGRNYLIDYRSLQSGGWVYVKKPFTDHMVLNDGSAFDEVRVYPEDAQMTTYTYDPLVGMTSSTDASGRTTYYEYDGFGRLKVVSDLDKQPVQQYDYHYQGQ